MGSIKRRGIIMSNRKVTVPEEVEKSERKFRFVLPEEGLKKLQEFMTIVAQGSAAGVINWEDAYQGLSNVINNSLKREEVK